MNSALSDFLNGCLPGSLPCTDELRCLLAEEWSTFEGSDQFATNDRKFTPDRVLTDVEWCPPLLSFVIERHGAIVGGGSGTADLYRWELNVIQSIATATRAGGRRVRPAAPALDVGPLVKRVVSAIVSKEIAPFLKWKGEDTVEILIGTLIRNEGPKTTVEGRRKRLREAITAELAKAGRRKGQRPNVYRHSGNEE